MHSHDRTLLASLGFSDRDKKEPLHDLACEYLAQPAQSERLVRLARPQAKNLSAKSAIEVLISKGEGQYRSAIGFLDARIDWQEEEANEAGSVFIEVKIHPVSIGDVLRQINLYRGYVQPSASLLSRLRAMEGRAYLREHWFLASAFELDSGQVETLRQSNVYPIHLGQGFTKWFEERQQKVAPTLEEF